LENYSGKWLNAPKHLLFAVDGHVARITLNRPDRRNALSNDLLGELHDALLEADDRVDINSILIDAAGKDFCAGYDLQASYDRRDADQKEAPNRSFEYRKSFGSFDDDCWNMERYPSLTSVISDCISP
jgi:enoyl-CoA hydratase